MKRTFITLSVLAGLVWSGSNLWLAGYQQGYRQAEEMAQDQARHTARILAFRDRPLDSITLLPAATSETMP